MRSHVVLVTAVAAMLTSAPAAWAQAFVTADSITPSSGSGLDQTFVLHYSDSTGAADLGAWVWFHDATAVATAPACLLAYTAATNTLNLLDDTGTTWSQRTLGALGFLENSQCRVTLVLSNATLDGTTLTLTLSMFFKPAWMGQKTADMYAASASGRNSGWGPTRLLERLVRVPCGAPMETHAGGWRQQRSGRRGRPRLRVECEWRRAVDHSHRHHRQ
jgi:hypothetical protein